MFIGKNVIKQIEIPSTALFPLASSLYLHGHEGGIPFGLGLALRELWKLHQLEVIVVPAIGSKVKG